MENRKIFLYSGITFLTLATAIIITSFIRKTDDKIRELNEENEIMNEIIDEYLKEDNYGIH